MEILLRDDCGYPGIAYDIISRLDGYDLFQLSRVSKAIQRTVKTRCWNPNRAFSPHFKDFRTFCGVMKECNAVISGSAALHFLDGRGTHSCGDIDVYLYGTSDENSYGRSDEVVENLTREHHENLIRIGKYLIEAEGYRYIPPAAKSGSHEEGYKYIPGSNVDPETTPAANIDMFLHDAAHRSGKDIREFDFVYPVLCRVYDFIRPETNRKVQLVVCRYTPEETILNFHSTAVCNIITSTHAISIFPKFTFQQRINRMTNSEKNVDVDWACIERYIQRGWFLDESKTHWGARAQADMGTLEWCIRKGIGMKSRLRPSYTMFDQRRIGDAFCWILPLEEPEDDRVERCGTAEQRDLGCALKGFYWMEAEVQGKIYSKLFSLDSDGPLKVTEYDREYYKEAFVDLN